jgi:hypothetical protein
MANCNVTTDTAGSTDALAAQVFCDNLIANCSTLTAGYTMDMCKATYMARSATLQHCQSYHLCWGVEGKDNTSAANPTTHCPHAQGAGPCQ